MTNNQSPTANLKAKEKSIEKTKHVFQWKLDKAVTIRKLIAIAKRFLKQNRCNQKTGSDG